MIDSLIKNNGVSVKKNNLLIKNNVLDVNDNGSPV